MFDVAQGPLFRFAFALLIFGLARLVLLTFSNLVGAYITADDRTLFWQKAKQHLLWFFFPSAILRRLHPGSGTGMFVYHSVLFGISLVFRFTAIIVPAFMVAHIYLWERGLGISLPCLPTGLADALSVITIVAGIVLFFGRLYSPTLRQLEPAWAFLKPLILIIPFVTGLMAMHPNWCPVDYHLMMLVHVLSALLIMVMIPFAKMFAGVHAPLTHLVPEMGWQTQENDAPGASSMATCS
jgi:hypothetical protein